MYVCVCIWSEYENLSKVRTAKLALDVIKPSNKTLLSDIPFYDLSISHSILNGKIALYSYFRSGKFDNYFQPGSKTIQSKYYFLRLPFCL